MRERLTIKAWLETGGQWPQIKTALEQRYPDQHEELLDRVKRLINHLVRHNIGTRATLVYALPTAADALTAEQFRMGLDLAVFSAEQKINPANMLQFGLATAAKALDGDQFNAAIDFSLRLIGNRINPEAALKSALPAAAKNSSSPLEFQAHLDTLERFIIDQGGHRYPRAMDGLPAVAALRPELFQAALETAGCLAENGFNPQGMLNALPAAAALGQEQLLARMDLCQSLAAKKIDLGDVFRTSLPAVAQVLTRSELLAGLDAVSRLAEKQIHPASMLQYGIPAAAAARTTPEDFQANLQAIEQFAVSVGAQDHNAYSGALQALSAISLTAEQLRVSLSLATRLAKRGIDLGQTLRVGLPPALQSSSLPGEAATNIEALEQFIARVTDRERDGQNNAQRNSSSRQQRHRYASAPHNLLQAIPQSGLNSWQYCAGLELLARLVENGNTNLALLLQHGLLVAARACATPEGFQANLQAIEQFAVSIGAQDYNRYSGALQALSAISLTAEQLRASLSLATRLAEEQIHPVAMLQYGIPSAAAARTAPEDFRLNLQALEQFIARVIVRERGGQNNAQRNASSRQQRNWYTGALHNLLQAIPQSGLNSRQYCVGLDRVARLAENGDANSALLLQHGLPAAAGACATPEDFQANLNSLEQFLARLAGRQVRNQPALTAGFQTALIAQSRAEFDLRIQTFDTLTARFERQRLSEDTAPGLAELTKQAVALRQSYVDFELIFYPAITSTYTDYDSYYGSTTHTQVDHHAWLELRPVGRRLTPIPLEPPSRKRIEQLLGQRSWLWNDSAGNAAREQVIERIIHLRAYLPAILDRLMRQGVLAPATELTSVYLIGSYPWVPAPNDVDLFLIVSGAREVEYLSATALGRRGIQIPELPIGVSVEIVGRETLLRASRGEEVTHAGALAKRYALLYGSVLLGGADIFQTSAAPAALLAELHQDLLRNMERGDWPELAGNPNKIAAKTAWRQREADALSRFLRIGAAER